MALTSKVLRYQTEEILCHVLSHWAKFKAINVDASARLPIVGHEVVHGSVARLTGRPVLLSLAAVHNMRNEVEHSRFDPVRSQVELWLSFRPMPETIADDVAWYRANGMLPAGSAT
ncbi:MAG: hypothetical protein KJ731_09230 [Alphaproteobacteria bacterium]|nr:hypothetical protein [Alphaproteobacteria bacterium]MBU1280433.1 hypothetical protein [Alphaproteobacteria bacterium]MBU1572930.1 hypothetical protein [Alphaproteobacteria bacterium]MBU1828642.1 hypothetical protein [Alphaproteobacteria bacterium]MBU2076648.1 hypothetical protein [Alphaproteobacteria bacterium]